MRFISLACAAGAVLTGCAKKQVESARGDEEVNQQIIVPEESFPRHQPQEDSGKSIETHPKSGRAQETIEQQAEEPISLDEVESKKERLDEVPVRGFGGSVPVSVVEREARLKEIRAEKIALEKATIMKLRSLRDVALKEAVVAAYRKKVFPLILEEDAIEQASADPVVGRPAWRGIV